MAQSPAPALIGHLPVAGEAPQAHSGQADKIKNAKGGHALAR